MADLRAKYEPIARQAAIGGGIDPDLFVRQITQESGWASDVIDCRRDSGAGARGIAQIVPRFHPGVDPCDPIAALEYAAGLMRGHLATWDGDAALALSSYNAGAGATRQGLAGTLDGWPYAETVNYVSAILQISRQEAACRLTGASLMPVSYDPNTPAIRQDDQWSCAPTALRWALMSLGRNPGPTYIEDLLVRDGVVSRELGLLDASGAGLAAWIGKREPADVYYGADGFYGNSEPSVTFQGAALEGDHAYPILIGGRQWGHWAAVRGYDAARNVLLLMNPSPGWMNVGDTMTPQQFGELGAFSMVRVLHPDLPGVGPPPVVEPPVIVVPPDTRLSRARALMVQALAVLDEPAPA